MSSVGEWIGSFSPKLRELGQTGKTLFGDAADQARASARQQIGKTVAESKEGQKIQKEYLAGKLREWGPLLLVTVIGGVVVVMLAGKR